jgi:hypothetical protein
MNPEQGELMAAPYLRRLVAGFPHRRPGFKPGWARGILWWTKLALGQVFYENFGFHYRSTFHHALQNHLHYHPRLAQCSAYSLIVQIKKNGDLMECKSSQDLQSYLDKSLDGVIYFSMGSNLRSSYIKNTTINALLQAFSQLKQRVLWKWETDSLPGTTSNVKVGKWLPQSDILGKLPRFFKVAPS